MRYIAEDNTIIESGPEPVVYTCKLPENISRSIGTFISLETSNKPDNTLQQIEVKRVYDEQGNVTVTITEKTPEEISQYFQSIAND